VASFNWLHLTDLHLGMTGERHLWPNVREAFFANLEELHRKSGPWDVVLFTGDLVQKGNPDEFDRLNREVLAPLWDRLQQLGPTPVLLAVPGNHDLQRPDPKRPPAAVRMLTKWSENPDIHEEFWEEPASEYRGAIAAAFASYDTWWANCPYRQPLVIQPGRLPGDFATTIEIEDGLRIGILGLNTTFLQLTEGDYTGRLAWDVRQFHDACGTDGPAWVGQHDACLLLTHQGPDWLNEPSHTKVYPEINAAGRFAVHLFGHMHENVIRSASHGGGRIVRQWQGCSLFSMEHYGEAQNENRRHGYAAGRIEFKKSAATIRHWPLRGVKDTNGRRFVRDEESCVLQKDGGTRREPIEYRPRGGRLPSGTRDTTRRTAQTGALDRERALSAYVEATQKFCDIVDLAGLPEDDRHLAMERFLLRQLYTPLRLSVDAPAEAKIGKDLLERIERRREQQRLLAAARLAAGGREGKAETYSLGPRLQASSRLVVLGDPGSGKTTLLRWVATACLMRRAGDPDLAQLPDADTLPPRDWLPVLVRCRELDGEQLKQCSLEDLLRQTLRKMEFPAGQTDRLTEMLRGLLADGRAILLVDGLDEVTNPTIRAVLCRQIDRIAEGYSSAPIIVTSRIVGYREMRFRLGKGFEHCTLADLSPGEKDAFVRRWCAVTERLPERRASEAEKLIQAIHSSDRIERLTGNPMLLTTMALVQRKVVKLPSRRHKLYEEAVDVLLNWRSDVDLPLDADEALPQLQYVAYAMCDRGVQRLRRDELLELLEGVRRDYPHIRPVLKHSPEEFLALLERRTSLIVEMGAARHDGRLIPVFEFRHLTFQEYLAALALVAGHFPGHDRSNTVAQRVARLAGRTSESRDTPGVLEFEVVENWREALRLCVACCNDDDVDDVLGAMVAPTQEEDATRIARPRAILGALCLADEPNVGQATAEDVVRRFAEQVQGQDGGGPVFTSVDRAAMELAASAWVRCLQVALVREFIARGPGTRATAGGLSAIVSGQALPSDPASMEPWMVSQATRMSPGSEAEAIEAALAIIQSSFGRRARMVPGLVEALLGLLELSPASAHAASWALSWLQGSEDRRGVWMPTPAELAHLVRFLEDPTTDPEALRWLANIFRCAHAPEAVEPCIALLSHPYLPARAAAVEALGSIGDPKAVPSLLGLLGDDRTYLRQIALGALARIRRDGIDSRLLSVDLDGMRPWLDPKSPIDDARVRQAGYRLILSPEFVRQRYDALAEAFHLTLTW
jgi:hypothetical protein